MKHTITSNDEVNSLFAEAHKSIQQNLIVLYSQELQTRGQAGRVAYLAGKRLGNAPRRNRAKRLLREAARLEGAPWQGYRVVLVAREACLRAELKDVQADLRRVREQVARLNNGSCRQAETSSL
ncbi:MAG: ribonuclease P protein component [Coriobacteriia bacterium]|nr:ribonuclease P protein component [Coriobacteriia bacterium]